MATDWRTYNDWDMQEEAFNGCLEKETTRFEKQVGCRDADGVQ
jgi:hypothetical protein